MVLLVSLTVVVGFSGLGSAALVADGGTSGALDSDASNDNAGDHQNESNDDGDDGENDKGHGNECDNNDEDNPGNSTGPDNRTNNPHCEEEPDDGEGNDNETNDGNGNETEGDLGSCEQGGAFQNATVANEAFGTENEEGPISSELHANEEEFQDLEPIVHEGSCVVATVDNNFQ